MTSNLDDLDDLEESRVDDNVSCGSFDEYFTDLFPLEYVSNVVTSRCTELAR